MGQVLKTGSRKFDLSDNWKVFHPNGKHMFTTSQRKANWYLERDLVKVIGINEVQFVIEPKGEGFADHEAFGLQPRLNRCVVCAEEEGLQRHHVVPYHYRKYMPLKYKSRNHHDVVLICRQHHEEYEIIAKSYKYDLAKKFDVESIEEMNARQINNMVTALKDQFKFLKLLDTVVNRFNDIPMSRLLWIANELKVGFDVDILAMDLEEIDDLHTKTDKVVRAKKMHLMTAENFYHGKAVIQKLHTEQDYEHFIRGWRMHFLSSMEPKFMPHGWTVDFTFYREQDNI